MDKTVSDSKRKALLGALPCLANWSSQEIKSLAALCTVVQYKANETLVLENAIVDCVFILVEGEAEVTQLTPVQRRLRKKPKMMDVPIATLGPGESIGLSDTGLFSMTGFRTATVTALTDVTALRLELTQLNHFFDQHPDLDAGMSASVENTLRRYLIKQSLPFSALTPERLEELSGQIEVIRVPAGSVIFHEGEVGDCCYLIQSGQVEVIVQDRKRKPRTLATLKAPMLFGEAALVTGEERNATTRALTDCVLLVLNHSYLSELMESEKAVSEMMMQLMVDRCRPVRNPAIRIYHRKDAAGLDLIILKNATNGKYFKLEKKGWFIWQQLDGKKTMQDIIFALADKCNVFEPDRVATLMLKLHKGGFIESLGIDEENFLPKPLWVRVMLRIQRILEVRVAIKNGDQWIDKLYKKAGYLVFTRWGKAMVTLIALCGLIAFMAFTPRAMDLFKALPDSKLLFILLLPLMVFSAAIHELGHALMTKSYGYDVKYIGVGWYWLGPVAFTDTSDMWLADRRSRIAVNIAGVVADTVTAGVCALLLWMLPHGYLQCFFWIFALYTYISAFRMLSPLQDWDGYYVLMDLFDRPRLRYSAVIWLTKGFPAAIRHPRLFRKNKVEIAYWLACLFYLIAIMLVTYWLQEFILNILNLSIHNKLMSFLLPIFMIVISSIGILADIRNQKS